MTTDSVSPLLTDAGENFKLIEVAGRINDLQKALLQKDDQFGTHLKAIHKTLQQYDDLPHLLSDDQIRTIFEGYKAYRSAEMVKKIASKGKTGGKRTVTADDI